MPIALPMYLDKLGTGVEEVRDEVVMNLGKGEVLGAIDAPGHVMTHAAVQT